MEGKSIYLQVILQQSTQNAANLLLQTYEKDSGLFLLYDTAVNLSLRNNFANLGSFAKVSFPVQSIIHCLYQGIVFLNKNGNSATFSPYVCNTKKI